MESLNTEIKTEIDNPFKTHYEEIKRCPKCESVFVTSKECESCGFQLNFNPLGDPLGDRSFYSIRERYLNQLSTLERANPSIENRSSEKAKRYINKVLMRYNLLLQYFYSPEDFQDQNHKFYLVEIKDIILDLIKYGVKEKDIWNKVTETEDDGEDFETSFYQRIALAIEEGKRDLKNETSFFRSLLTYRLGGVVKLINIFFLGLGITAALFAAISYFRFLAMG